MRYVDFRDTIEAELRRHPDGLTWMQLKEKLKLPYSSPCCTWVGRLEEEIGLCRDRSGRSLNWKVKPPAAD